MSEQHLKQLKSLLDYYGEINDADKAALEWAIEQLTPKPVTEASLIAEKAVTPKTIEVGFERDFPNPAVRDAMYAITTDKLKSMPVTLEALERGVKHMEARKKIGFYVELNPETGRYDIMYAGQPYVSGFYHQHMAERACDKLNAKGG